MREGTGKVEIQSSELQSGIGPALKGLGRRFAMHADGATKADRSNSDRARPTRAFPASPSDGMMDLAGLFFASFLKPLL